MLVAHAGASEVRAVLAPHESSAALAAVNGDKEVVLSGTAGAIESIKAALERAGMRTRAVHSLHAFHSPLLDPALAEIERAAERLRPSGSEPKLSSVGARAASACGSAVPTIIGLFGVCGIAA